MKEIHFCILICIRIAHGNLDMLKIMSDVRRVFYVCNVRYTSIVWSSLERGEKILNFDTSWRSLAILDQKLQHFLYCVVEAQGLILKLGISSFQKCYWNINPNYSHVWIILLPKSKLVLIHVLPLIIAIVLILICINIAHSNLDMLKIMSDFQRVCYVCNVRHTSNGKRGKKQNFDSKWRPLAILDQKLQHFLYCVIEAQGLILKLRISSRQKCY